MKTIFSKSSFPQAPGGDRYEWKESETNFKIAKTGLHLIKISAKAKSAAQNNSTDDDDFRIALDGFHFGKYEHRADKDKIAWKGFGTSSSWNGASLKGGTKIIYYFVELDKGEHILQFFADGTPEIIALEIATVEDLHFELTNFTPEENIQSSTKGIPWLSLIFLGTNAKSLFLDVATKNAKEKSTTDGDNLKIVVNGKILKNPKSPTSRKYKNFYFSGDLKTSDQLSISKDQLSDPLAFENSVELWYDQQPKLSKITIDFFDTEEFLEEFKILDFKEHIIVLAWLAIGHFKLLHKPYSAQFLRHALKDNPEPLIFKSKHPIVHKIKADPTYKKIGAKLTEKLKDGQINGEIWPKDFNNDPEMKGQINFDSHDLASAIHGIKKIEYEAKLEKNSQFSVKLTIFDIYDFQRAEIPKFLFHQILKIQQHVINTLDFGESIEIINNFEIQININYTLWV